MARGNWGWSPHIKGSRKLITEEKTMHTPGPWKAIEEVPLHTTWRFRVVAGGDDIAYIYENGNANARLIAAAPTLLEALETIGVHDSSCHHCAGLLRGNWGMIRAAIQAAKETG